jgi:hypothetical protein
MMMRVTVLMLAALPGMTLADGWRTLAGGEIPAALSDRELVYADGTRQTFRPGGETYYADTTGHWRVEGDQYCSVWPPSDRWTCYGVEVSGADVRFKAADGSATQGRYDDLN